MKFITIYNTIHSSEIAIIRNLLDENNINYQVPDEMTNSASGMAGLGMAGMRVLVPEEQSEQAKEILRARGFS